MISGQTTWEIASRFRIPYLRDLDPPINPFDEGCICNVVHFFICTNQLDWDNIYQKRLQKLQISA